MGRSGGFLERVGGGQAVTQPPTGKARRPVGFRNPRAGTLGSGQRNGARGRIVILDVEGPADLLPPFGAGIGRKRCVYAVEQNARTNRIVEFDPFDDGIRNRYRHCAVADRARANALGNVGKGEKPL